MDLLLSFWVCCVAYVGCATDELWSTPDHKRNEHDPKQRVGEVLPKFYSVYVYLLLIPLSIPLSLLSLLCIDCIGIYIRLGLIPLFILIKCIWLLVWQC